MLILGCGGEGNIDTYLPFCVWNVSIARCITWSAYSLLNLLTCSGFCSVNLTFYSKTVPDHLDQGWLSSDKAQARSGYSLMFLLFTKISIVRRAHTYLPYICLHWSANQTWLVDGSSSPSVLAHLSHLSLYCPHLWCQFCTGLSLGQV